MLLQIAEELSRRGRMVPRCDRRLLREAGLQEAGESIIIKNAMSDGNLRQQEFIIIAVRRESTARTIVQK